MATKNVKLVIVGDTSTGKTCLPHVFVRNQFPELDVPRVFDHFTYNDGHTPTIEVDGKRVELSIFDTIGSEDYDRLRPLSYRNADVFIICFSIESLENGSLKSDISAPKLPSSLWATSLILEMIQT